MKYSRDMEVRWTHISKTYKRFLSLILFTQFKVLLRWCWQRLAKSLESWELPSTWVASINNHLNNLWTWYSWTLMKVSGLGQIPAVAQTYYNGFPISSLYSTSLQNWPPCAALQWKSSAIVFIWLVKCYNPASWGSCKRSLAVNSH